MSTRTYLRIRHMLTAIIMCLCCYNVNAQNVGPVLIDTTRNGVPLADVPIPAQAKSDSGLDIPADGLNINIEREKTLKAPRIVFLGDSQIALNKGAMPLAFAEDVDAKVDFYSRVAANAKHYLGEAKVLTSTIGTSFEELIGKNCLEASKFVLETYKPDIVILELGHNGTWGLQDFINKLQDNGIETFLIQMFPIPVIKNIEARYEGITAQHLINLFDMKVATLKDRIHAPAEEMQRVGHRVAEEFLKVYPSLRKETKSETEE